ncbi:tetraspanin-32 isoform X2 [Sciurus carolinensis]|uniref:tetraspanin-32 isoform X2 n=1 Tax=Sciurus carolinensis TaxID=30640 RepID=UPI001FB41E2D|nr:tetraspanin-32 isoform X2 [Sciurus carolinensis]
MGPGRRVRVAKCQMLLTCFLVLLLSLSVATLAVRAHFGDHFAVVSQASLERNPCEAMSHWVFYTGISLAGLLSLGAALSAAATTREAQGPLAMGFLCFALVFCSLVQVAFWRFHNPTQVEDAMLDTFDLVYHQAVRSPSRIRAQELAAIQDTFLCCGKRSPFQLLGSGEVDPCQGEKAAGEDCLQSIRSFLKTQQNIASMLTSAGLALTSLWLPGAGAQPLHTLPGWTCTSTPLRSRDSCWSSGSKRMLGRTSSTSGLMS